MPVKQDINKKVKDILEDIKNDKFSPIYLLMGAESYYSDLICDAIVKNCLAEHERDFNQTIWFGMDIKSEDVGTQARSYPVMAERRLLVIKDAQSMSDLEKLSTYCEEPMESTVLVLLLHEAVVDKRKALYKAISKNGVVLESEAIRDYQIHSWINDFYKEKGLIISADAISLLAEFVGTSLIKIAAETEKLIKSLPEGTKKITVEDVEKNVGMTRQFSIFELKKALFQKDRGNAIKIASNIGSAPDFSIIMATNMLFTDFNVLLKYIVFLKKQPGVSPADKSRFLGISPYFLREYDVALQNYSIKDCFRIIDLLEEYNFKGTGGNVGEATQSELLIELIVKILN